jgi:membrane protease YdiL (CAAX protease family)
MWPRAARVASVSAAALLLIAIVSWTSVLSQLGSEADDLRREWRAQGAALRWDLSQPESLVFPGSFGIEETDFREGALTPRFATPDLDLSLALPAGSVPIAAIDTARLQVRSASPFTAWIIATDAAGRAVSGAVATAARDFDGELELPLPRLPAPGSIVRSLRLHLAGSPGQEIALRTFELRSLATYDDTPCATQHDVAGAMTRCGRRPARLIAPAFVTPEGLLRWRDGVLASALAVIEPPLRIASFSRRARTLVAGAGMLIALALLGAHWRLAARRDADPGPRAIELLVIAPLCLQLWLGVGYGDTTTFDVAAFILCSVALWLLRAPAAPPFTWSSAAAWRASAGYALLPVVLLLVLLLANALDADGLRLRSINPDRLWFYPLWALLQQILIMHVLAPRTRAVTGDAATGALLAGLLFALLHTPNFALMIATFIAGSLWAWIGYRQRALLPLAASHAIAGLLLVLLAPEWLLRSAEIGGRYLLPP